VPMEYPVPDPLDVEQLFSKEIPWANVQYFGAKGNGTHDDTSAIQSALNSSKFVYFPPLPDPGLPHNNKDFYKVTSDLNTNPRQVILGSHWAAPVCGTSSNITHVLTLDPDRPTVMNLMIGVDNSLSSADITDAVWGSGMDMGNFLNLKIWGGGVINNGFKFEDSAGGDASNGMQFNLCDVDSVANEGYALVGNANNNDISNSIAFNSGSNGLHLGTNTYKNHIFSLRLNRNNLGAYVEGTEHVFGTISVARPDTDGFSIAGSDCSIAELKVIDVNQGGGGGSCFTVGGDDNHVGVLDCLDTRSPQATDNALWTNASRLIVDRLIDNSGGGVADNGTDNLIGGMGTEDLGVSPTSAPTGTYPEGAVIRNSNADNNETWAKVRGTWVQVV